MGLGKDKVYFTRRWMQTTCRTRIICDSRRHDDVETLEKAKGLKSSTINPPKYKIFMGARIFQMTCTQINISHTMVYNSENSYNPDILFSKNGRVKQISQLIRGQWFCLFSSHNQRFSS